MKLKLAYSLIITALIISSCARKLEPVQVPAPPMYGYLQGMITDAQSLSGIEGARIYVYNSTTQEPTGDATSSDASGNYKIQLPPGDYFVKVSKQGYYDVTPRGIPAIPFTIVLSETTVNDVEMFESNLTDAGWISGTVNSSSSSNVGALVVASDGTNGYSSVSDSSGYYIIYNVPAGTYDVQAWVAGSNSDQNSATVTGSAETSDVDLNLTDDASGSVSGQVTFLSTQNAEVDVSLTHEVTGEAIPGLSTVTASQNYSIDNVPNGTFLARATYDNDTKVMDPDWIIKNGEPYVTVASSNETRDFSVTGAITVISPSNDPSSTQPIEITTTSPTFEWEAYSSTSDYVLEVRDAYGNLIWGGFSNNWTVKNDTIPASQTSIVFNDDGKATESLQVGKTYRWRIYASKDAGGGSSWNLISASEEQMGLFIIK